MTQDEAMKMIKQIPDWDNLTDAQRLDRMQRIQDGNVYIQYLNEDEMKQLGVGYGDTHSTFRGLLRK